MELVKTAVLSMAAALMLPIGVQAQGQTLSASPIPDGVENRFCYYAGLAYSLNSYIIISSSNSVTATSSETRERLLECVAADDGSLRWVGRSKIQNG